MENEFRIKLNYEYYYISANNTFHGRIKEYIKILNVEWLQSISG
jgi:hypothetical protein